MSHPDKPYRSEEISPVDALLFFPWAANHEVNNAYNDDVDDK